MPGVAAVSDRGRRHQHNEDAVALRVLTAERDGRAAVLAVLCDGVSRAARPDLASAAAADAGVEALAAAVLSPALASGSTDAGDLTSGDPAAAGGAATVETAVRHAAAMAAAAVADLTGRLGMPEPPACTFIAAAVVDGSVTVGWIGDSRAYWLPSGRAATGIRLTEDDSWCTDIVARGRLSAADAAADRRAHVLTAWLGVDAPDVPVHIETLTPAAPGVLVLCTDGLWNYRSTPEAIEADLPVTAIDDPLDAARELVNTALRCGGQDNITVAVLPLRGPPSPGGER